MSPTEAVKTVKKIPLQWFLVLLLWGGAVAVYPAASFVLDSWHDYPGDPINWKMVWHMSGPLFIAGCYGGFKKYQAYLQLPPGIEDLIALKRTVDTLSLTGRRDDPNPVVTHTLETTTVAVAPPPATPPPPETK